MVDEVFYLFMCYNVVESNGRIDYVVICSDFFIFSVWGFGIFSVGSVDFFSG